MFDRATPRAIRCALILLAVWVVADTAVTLGGGLDDSGQVQRFIYDGMLVLAGALTMLRSRWSGGERAPWLLIGAGTAAWGLGDVWFTAHFWTTDDIPVPSPADAGYLLLPPLVAGGFVALLRGRMQRVSGARRADGATAALAVAAVGAALVFDTVREAAAGGRLLEVATNLAYPLTDLLLIAVCVGALASRGWALDRFWIVAGLGILAFWVADSMYLVQTSNGTYESGSWFDGGWSVGIVCVALAAWQPVRDQAAARDHLRAFAMPLLFATVALVLLVVAGLTEISPLAIALAAIALSATGVRLVLTFRDNLRMLRSSQEEAATDALTGIGNRRALARELAAALDAGKPAVLALCDLDGFKRYNDTFGHPAGDALLVRLGGRLAQMVEGQGGAYRMGGDEFCALLDCGEQEARALVAGVRAALSERGDGFDVGCSVGFVVLPAEALSAEEALRKADQRLYQAKNGGRGSARAQSRDVLLRALVERSPDLEAHVTDVAALAQAAATRLGLSEAELDEIRHAAELHDIGKVAVPDAILRKPGPLDEVEWSFIRQHTIIGERILSAAPALSRVAKIVRASHERWDGAGYPDGLAGEDIPLGARIVAVADAFDAMIVDRPYRLARGRAEALGELRRCAGRQFDPAVVEAFCAAIAAGAALDGRMAARWA